MTNYSPRRSKIGNLLLPINFDQVSKDLVKHDQWCVWDDKLIEGGGRVSRGYSPRTGQVLSLTDKNSWGTFQAARELVENGRYDGLGFVLHRTDPFWVFMVSGIADLSERVNEDAIRLVHGLDSYTELSVDTLSSVTVFRGQLPTTLPGKDLHRSPLTVGMWQERRWFPITGFVPDGISKMVREMPADLIEWSWNQLSENGNSFPYGLN